MQKGKPAKKYSQASRLHTIIRLFEARHGMTIDELAEECEVDRRTIYRDLNALENAGYTVVTEWQVGRKVYSFLSKSKTLPPITFTLNQLMSLYLLRSMAVYLAGTPFIADIDDLFCSINSVLPDRYGAHLERIARVSLPIAQGVRDYSTASAYLADLQRALLHQYRIRLNYAKKGDGSIDCYELDPYTLVFHKGGIYLLAYAHNRSGMRLFALERFCSIELTRQHFEIFDGYKPEAYFSTAFGLVTEKPMKVKIRFSPDVAQSVKGRIWMTGQTLYAEADGSIIIEFEASGEMELVSWILSYGMHAEVIKPPKLKHEVKKHIYKLYRLYD